MKVAFVEPAIMQVEPLGVGYLAQILIDQGHQVRYFEAPRARFFQRIKAFNPQVLAFSIVTGKHRLAQELNAKLRKAIGAISLFGGPHCTFYPEFIENDELIDGICRGEGEYAMAQLLRRIEGAQDYTETANWWLRVNGKIYKNDVRMKIENLDILPFPNREIIYAENAALRDIPIKRVLGSRGCPFACSYCFNKQYNAIYQGRGKVYLQRSVENIVREVVEVQQRYPITFLKFTEDIFGMESDYDKFARIYRRKVGLPFLCNLRANLVSEEKIKKLKQAGCVAVTMGVESGNEFVRNKIFKRNLSLEVLERALEIIKGSGIRVWTQNIIANPSETFAMAMETLNLNAKHRVDFAECSLLTPYPGTEIYQYCVANNYFDGKVESLTRSYWLDSPLRFSSQREKKRLVNFQKFFSFTVQHPKAWPLVKLLIALAPNRLFVLFSRLYDVWRISRLTRAQFTLRGLIAAVKINLQYVFTYF